MSYQKRASESYSMRRKRYQPTQFRKPIPFEKRDIFTEEREIFGHPISKRTIKTKTEMTQSPSRLSSENQTSYGVGVGNNLVNVQGSLSKANKTEIKF